MSQGTGVGTQADLARSPVLPAGPQEAGCFSRTCAAGPGEWKNPLKKIFFFSYDGIASLFHFTTMQVHFDLHIESSMF